MTEGEHYGDANIGQGGNVPIDMSAPNIAKPFSIGHLRSTVIGDSIAKIYEKLGYQPIKINQDVYKRQIVSFMIIFQWIIFCILI